MVKNLPYNAGDMGSIRVRSLVGELRSHMLRGVARPRGEKKYIYIYMIFSSYIFLNHTHRSPQELRAGKN